MSREATSPTSSSETASKRVPVDHSSIGVVLVMGSIFVSLGPEKDPAPGRIHKHPAFPPFEFRSDRDSHLIGR